MSISDNLGDLGVDVLVATEMMRKMNIEPDMLESNEIYGMFKDIVNYLGKFENRNYILTKLTSKPSDNQIKKVWEYVKLQQVRENIVKMIENTDKEYKLVENLKEAEDKKGELIQRKALESKKLDDITKEIKLYE